jgi:hypothetical protein
VVGPTGSQGEVGPTGADSTVAGPTGAAGEFVPKSDSPPLSPEPGELWFDTNNGAVFVYYDNFWVEVGTSEFGGATGPQGIQGEIGPLGPTGATGDEGPLGPTGVAGATGPIVTGPAGPQGVGSQAQGFYNTFAEFSAAAGATAGAIGDFYVIYEENTIYIYTADNGWIEAGALIGPVGPTGITGNVGATGATGATGPSVTGPIGPQGTSINVEGSVSTAANLPLTGNAVNDAYIVDDNGDLYVWDGLNWNSVGQIVGPTGAIGVTGPTGPSVTGATGPASTIPGPQGSQGPAGPKGGVVYTISSSGEGGFYSSQGVVGNNPNLVAVRGERLYIDTSAVLLTNSLALRLSSGSTSTVPGTLNNSTVSGRNGTSTDPVIIYDVPLDAPVQIIYQDVTDPSVAGVIDVVDKIGPTGATGAAGPAGTPQEISYAPVFGGDDLGVSGTPATGNYVKNGKAIVFNVDIDCTTVSSFGTAQYSITLPVLPEPAMSNSFVGALDLDGTGATLYNVIGFGGQGSAILDLWYLGASGALTAFTGVAPDTLTTSSKLYLSGSYIADSE